MREFILGTDRCCKKSLGISMFPRLFCAWCSKINSSLAGREIVSEPLTPGEVARHSRDGEGKSEHFHEALSVSLSLDSSPRGRAFLLVKLEFIFPPTLAVWVEATNSHRPHARIACPCYGPRIYNKIPPYQLHFTLWLFFALNLRNIIVI
jgi:hypothetical protein